MLPLGISRVPYIADLPPPIVIRPDGVPPPLARVNLLLVDSMKSATHTAAILVMGLDVGGKRDECLFDVPADGLCAFGYVVQFSANGAALADASLNDAPHVAKRRVVS